MNTKTGKGEKYVCILLIMFSDMVNVCSAQNEGEILMYFFSSRLFFYSMQHWHAKLK